MEWMILPSCSRGEPIRIELGTNTARAFIVFTVLARTQLRYTSSGSASAQPLVPSAVSRVIDIHSCEQVSRSVGMFYVKAKALTIS